MFGVSTINELIMGEEGDELEKGAELWNASEKGHSSPR